MADQRRPSADNPVDGDAGFHDTEDSNDFDEFNEDYASSIHTTLSRTENPFMAAHENEAENVVPVEDDFASTLHRRLSADVSSLSQPAQPRTSTQKPPQPFHRHSSSFSFDSSRQNNNNNNDDGIAVFTSATNLPSPSSTPQPRSRPTPLHLRTLSLASSSSYAPASSPTTQDGSGGPSHPYNLYPQGLGMSRSASIASSSNTPRGLSRMNSRRGPAHPYSLYPQNVGTEDAMPSSSTSYPIGFPGHQQQSYHRRLGPEGEEQDIVGEDGHAEQLPPYSRFPENHPVPKFPIQGNGGLLEPIGEGSGSGSGSGSGEHSNSSPQDGRSEMQERNSISRSAVSTSFLTADNPAPSRAASTRLLRESSSMGSNAAVAVNEDRRWYRKRVLGLPLWLLINFIVLLMIVAIVCAAAIAVAVNHHHKKHEHVTGTVTNRPTSIQSNPQNYPGETAPISSVATVTTTEFIDATPFLTSSGAPPPPTGTFKIPISYGLVTDNRCIADVDLQPAWACMMNSDAVVGIDYNSTDGSSYLSMTTANVTYGYGTQPPSFGPQKLTLVEDKFSLNLGPAYYFQTFYDKLVIVRYSRFPPNGSMDKRDLTQHEDDYEEEAEDDETEDVEDVASKRDYDILPQLRTFFREFLMHAEIAPPPHPFNNPWSSPFWPQRQYLPVNEPVWFCYWNQTMIEGFLFVDQIGNAPPGSPPSAISNPADYASVMSETPSLSSSSLTGTAMMETAANSAASATTRPPTGPRHRDSPLNDYWSGTSSPIHRRGEPNSPLTGIPSLSPFSPGSTSAAPSAASSGSAANTLSVSESTYLPNPTGATLWGGNKFLKLEERRIYGTHNGPYCVAVMRDNNGNVQPIAGENWRYIPEQDPAPLSFSKRGKGKKSKRRRAATAVGPSDIYGRSVGNAVGGSGGLGFERNVMNNECFCEWVET